MASDLMNLDWTISDLSGVALGVGYLGYINIGTGVLEALAFVLIITSVISRYHHINNG
jgi:hypothetical protein